ncbi:MAG: hypothetical protein IJ083_06765 [Clostridia bacterium]|nr:hypothetical protein [Clostridia bacterium]
MFLVMALLIAAVPAPAEGFGSLFGILSGILGEEQETEGDLPEITFTGKRVKVVLDSGRTLKVHEDFKAAMDAYEAFFDEYVAFMSSAGSLTDVLRYTEMTLRYAEAMEKLDKLDESDMDTDDSLYFTWVMLKIEEKLLKTLGSIY